MVAPFRSRLIQALPRSRSLVTALAAAGLSVGLCLSSSPRAFVAGTAYAAAAPVAESRCLEDWTTAAPIVHREALRPAKDVRVLAQKNSPGQLLTIKLCQEQGRYVYRLTILRTAGTVDTLTVDARTPFGR